MKLNVKTIITVTKEVEVNVPTDFSDNIDRYLDDKFGVRGWLSWEVPK